jgi:two-component system CheB/CheR fusion protein
LFNLIPTDVGRPLADLQHHLQYPDLMRDTARVLQLLVPVEREVSEDGGRAFLVRVLPYRTIDDRIAGVVLTFVDITERQAAQAAMQQARNDLEVRVQERTAQLDDVNSKLRAEVKGHEQAERARLNLQRLLLDAQEQERSRISRELHDEVGQQISALMLSLKELESAEPGPELQSKLKSLRTTTEQVAREIHQLAFELRPVALDELGLSRALGSYLDGWVARTGIAIDFVSAGLDERRLPPQIETVVYRIVQEAMNNVYKHASAKSVSISIERRSDYLLGIVEDDGVSFDPEGPSGEGEPPRIGIAGMRERAALVGGDLTIDARPGHGTTVRVRLPIPSPSPSSSELKPN